MGAGRKTYTFLGSESAPSTPDQTTAHACARNLKKSHLGGVIFGCKSSTIKECLFKQLFGLPAHHFLYVKNIDPGLPLFLFNYSDRKLHGIFEAASPGQMNINPYGWTMDGSDRTQYPAQVQICVQLQCQPLLEDQFRPIIADNYYSQNRFWFELDHAQTSKLINLLSSKAVASSTSLLQNTAKWRTLFQAALLDDSKETNEVSKPLDSEVAFSCLDQSNGNPDSADVALCLDRENPPLEAHSDVQFVKDEVDRLYRKLKKLSFDREYSSLSLVNHVDNTIAVNDMQLEDRVILEAQALSEEKNEKSPDSPSDIQSVVTKEIEELKGFRTEQVERMGYLEQKLIEAEREIQYLKDRCMMFESMSNPTTTDVNEALIETSDELRLDVDEFIYLVGGYDGVSWLAALDAYSPSRDVLKSLKSMNYVRSYASVAKLNGEIYVFGGGNGCSWYDSVETYNPANNQWTPRPSLNRKKGSLAGVTLDNKIFAVGGGNGVECFSDVEMFDLDVGRWITTRSMLQKRFALAAAELNGVLYAVGGYDGKDYLKSAERFDPREHSWMKIGSMNTKRGCHSIAVLNEKLYALGGFDGRDMVPSVEIFDPRMGSWVYGDPMNQPRGYSATAVVMDSIYIIGGVKDGVDIVDTIECYDGCRWLERNPRAIGKRCFSSAIAL
ncbi:uncharacterized protein LOC131155742 isoform X2 [Malania oleifera]|uniref:uncharacterized protein LOC131155742 isoform X2 n=1 Tax=Malania oleifera TaxID=397392 RepID=UPI0025AECD9F|nr:uncharacterized protein LOC131155742 isoform X2 [Malania oleifera]